MSAPGPPSLRPIRELDQLSAAELAEALKPLFEMAAPLTTALAGRRPFVSYAALVDAAEAIAVSLPRAAQIEVLNAHPRIGESPARLSALSLREQGYADRVAHAADDQARVDAELAELNRAYEVKFGFRCVVFVNQRPRAEMVEVLRERLGRPAAEELASGLREMFRIARDRLHRLGAG